jgi:hypothetical protein
MQTIVEKYLASLVVGEGTAFEKMRLFPIFREGGSPLKYRVLAEALADGSVEVREKPSATVPELWLVNHSEHMVLVLGGEEVVGGKQNRMVNASCLIAPRSELALPVTCVEHGRWHHQSASFGAGEAVYHSLRKETSLQVKQGLRATSRPLADQGAVWDEIADRSRALQIHSPTMAMHALYEQRTGRLADYEQAFPVVEGAVGVAVTLGSQLAGADLFDQPATAARLWARLVRSYALDALDAPAGNGCDKGQVAGFLARLASARTEVYPSLGVGQDVRLGGAGVEGAALVYEDVVVHLSAFPAAAPANGIQPAAHHGHVARASTRQRLARTPGNGQPG